MSPVHDPEVHRGAEGPLTTREELTAHLINDHGKSEKALVAAGPWTVNGLQLVHDLDHEHKDVDHKIRWYARSPDHPDDWAPRTQHMRGGDFGWDVKCSCGQESHTGGYIESAMREKVRDHKEWGDPL